MKLIKIIVITVFLCFITGCTDKVNSLIEQGKYEEALILVEENPEKYKDIYDEIRYHNAKISFENGDYEQAITLLENNFYSGSSEIRNKALNLKSAIEIEYYYNELLHEKDEHNPDRWIPNFYYMDGVDFYIRLNGMLDDAYDTIVKDNSLENANDKLLELFGVVPPVVSQAKSIIDMFRDESHLYKLDKMQYAQPYALDYLMDGLTKYNKFVRFEMTKSSGYMIIEKPYDFLQSKMISSKTFSYLLGVCEDYGANVSRNKDRIEVHWPYWENAMGYYYCAPNTQHNDLKKIYNTSTLIIEEGIIYDDGLEVNLTFDFSEKIDAKYISSSFFLANRDGFEIASVYSLKKDVNSDSIEYTIFFEDIDESDLPGDEFIINYLWTIVLND